MNLFTELTHYALPFLCVLTALVFVHELGHYLVARWNGVRVEVFSIGFGPELIGWTDRAGTRWKISVLPFGGYVKMFGEASDEPAQPLAADAVLAGPGPGGVAPAGAAVPVVLTAEDKAVSFAYKTVWQRAAIVVAGPLANFIFAVVVTAVLFATAGQQLTSTVVSGVKADSAAAAAGIEKGDKILALNGQAVSRFEEIAAQVQLGLGEPLRISLDRAGKTIEVTATPSVVEQVDIFGDRHRIGLLGIEAEGPGETVRYDPLTATWKGVTETYARAVGMLKAIGQIITGIRPSNEVGGVLRIAKMSGDIASRSLIGVVDFAVLLSINLGLINLFPIPLLDGGRLVFYGVEVLRGRPLGARAEEWGLRVGLALVLSLMLFATWNDLVSMKVIQFLKTVFA
jgi:regulator of sigma E protease